MSYILDVCLFLNGSVLILSFFVVFFFNLFYMFYISLLVIGLNCFYRYWGDIMVDMLMEFVFWVLGRDSVIVWCYYIIELIIINFYEILGIFC